MLKQACKLSPSIFAALVLLASVLSADARDFADEIQGPPKMKAATLDRVYAGDRLVDEGKWSEATKEYDAAMALEPKNIQPCLAAAAKLSAKGDPFLCYQAMAYLRAGEEIHANDPHIILLKANVEQKLGNKKEALALFEQDRKYILVDRNNKGDDAILIDGIITHLKREIATAKPAPVKVEDRHYQMNNVAAVYLSTGEICKLAIYGGHDPDGGKQDGTDDGIIEFKKENINTPDKVYRRKNQN